MDIDGVLGYRDLHVWAHSTSVIVATVHVQIRDNAFEQKILTSVSTLLRKLQVHFLTVQIQKVV